MKRLFLFLIFIFPLCKIIAQNQIDMKLLGKWCVEDANFGNTPYCFEITMNRYGKLCVKVPASMENHQVTAWQNTTADSYIDSSDSNVNHYFFESVNSRKRVCYGVNYLHPSGTYEYRAIRIIIWANKIEEERLSVYVSYFYGPMEDRKKELGDLVFKKVGEVESPQLLDNKQTRKKGELGEIAEAIDLGLSVKWASWNVGASKPEEYGGYYGWGETYEKDNYDRDTYIYCDGDIVGASDINIYKTEFDVAFVKWGGDWRLPTCDDFKELINNCKYEYVVLNGVEGGKFTGSNGNSIFLPAAGCCQWKSTYFDMLDPRGADGEYWTGDLYYNDNDEAFYFRFYESRNDAFFNCDKRWIGRQVRPVKTR